MRHILALLLIAGTAHAATLRIDIIALNDAGTSTVGVERITINDPAVAARLQAAVDAQDSGGTSLQRLKARIVQRMRELVRQHEIEQANIAAHTNLQATVDAITEIPVQ